MRDNISLDVFSYCLSLTRLSQYQCTQIYLIYVDFGYSLNIIFVYLVLKEEKSNRATQETKHEYFDDKNIPQDVNNNRNMSLSIRNTNYSFILSNNSLYIPI